MAKKEKPEKAVIITGPYTQLIFECTVCKKIYDKPGYCKECDLLLKPKGG